MIGYEDEFSDLIAVLALGALPEAEALRVSAHLETCDACRSLYADLRPVANAIGFAAESTALDELASARMKARLLRAVRVEDQAIVPPQRQRAPQFGWYAAAAAVVAAVAIGADNLSLRGKAAQTASAQSAEVAAGHSRLVAVQSDERALRSELSALVAPGNKHYPVPQGEIVTNAGHVVVALRLAALPSGKVYQAWTLAKGAKTVAPSVTFSAEPGGGVAIVNLPVDATGLAAVAVSVEPTGGSKAPTSTPKFVRKLS